MAVVLAVDAGTTSIRAAFVASPTPPSSASGAVILSSAAVPIHTTNGESGLAEQSPAEWSAAMEEAIRRATAALPETFSVDDVKAVSVVATTCKFLFLLLTMRLTSYRVTSCCLHRTITMRLTSYRVTSCCLLAPYHHASIERYFGCS